MSSGFTRVDCNCTHMIHLPPSGDYPDGHRLAPGVNKVPTDYLESLRAFKVPYICAQTGRRGSRTLFEDLAEPSKTSNGKARVAILGDVSPDVEEGPEPPFSLDEYSELVAVKIVEATSNKAALQRWARDKRADVANAAGAKLAGTTVRKF